MSYICYHHNDMDGKAAGNEVYKHLTRSGIKCFPSMFIMRGYDEPFKESDYNNKTVFIVDLSFTKESIKKLFTICEGASSVTWIDHHLSSKECIEDDEIRKKLNNYANLTYIVNTNACGALLSYLYFNNILDFGNFKSEDSIDFEINYNSLGQIVVVNPDADSKLTEIPKYMKLVDSWDRWIYGNDKDPVFFNFGTQVHNTALFAYLDRSATEKTYNHRFWRAIESETYINKILTEGNTIKKYFDRQSGINVSRRSYECNIEGHKALVMNSEAGSSMAFGNKIKDYDLVCIWRYNGQSGRYEYSLYSDKENVNCAAIATKLEPSGGGHPGAAGFSLDRLIFKK